MCTPLSYIIVDLTSTSQEAILSRKTWGKAERKAPPTKALAIFFFFFFAKDVIGKNNMKVTEYSGVQMDRLPLRIYDKFG